MQTIKSILGFPSGTPIDSVQAKIVKVWPRTDIPNGTYGPTSVQNAGIQDASGSKIKLKVWGHPDIAKMEGQEVVIHASPKGKGLAVKLDKGKDRDGNPKEELVLEVGKVGQFQLVAVYNAGKASNGASDTPANTQTPPSAQNASNAKQTASGGTVHGATAGLAVNKAIEILGDQALQLARGDELESAVVKIGSQIVRAALRLESGEGSTKASQVKTVEAPAPAPSQDNPDEDVPF